MSLTGSPDRFGQNTPLAPTGRPSHALGFDPGRGQAPRENCVTLSSGKSISVTCTAWIHAEYLATQKTCEAYE
jgi:hypothetical protein